MVVEPSGWPGYAHVVVAVHDKANIDGLKMKKE